MRIEIDTPEGDASFHVQVMKTQEYTIEKIFERNLLMLIPFYIFSHEKRFAEYNTNEKILDKLKVEYLDIMDRLNSLKRNSQITEYQHRMILDMSIKVLENLAAKYDKVMEGIKEIMIGRIIETEASKIYHEGEAQGIAIGKSQGIAIGEARKSEWTAIRLHAKGTDLVEIADVLDVDIQQVQKWIRKGSAAD